VDQPRHPADPADEIQRAFRAAPAKMFASQHAGVAAPNSSPSARAGPAACPLSGVIGRPRYDAPGPVRLGGT